MKPGERRRSWTEDEDRELREIAAYTLEHKRLQGYRESPAGRLRTFALKHGRTEAAVKMRARRIAARSYWGRGESMVETEAMHRYLKQRFYETVNSLNTSPLEGTRFYCEDRSSDDYLYVEIGQSTEGTPRACCGVVYHNGDVSVLPFDPSERRDMFVISPAVDRLCLKYPDGQKRTIPREELWPAVREFLEPLFS